MHFRTFLFILCSTIALPSWLVATDTDQDGVLDALEILEGTDPNDATDFNAHSRDLVLMSLYDDEFDYISESVAVSPPQDTESYYFTSEQNRTFIFSNSNSGILLETDDLPFGAEFTISVWINFLKEGADGDFYVAFPEVDETSSAPRGSYFGIAEEFNGIMLWRGGSTPYDLWTNKHLEIGLHHIVCTINEGTGKFYIDGNLYLSGAAKGTMNLPNDGITLLYSHYNRLMEDIGISNLRIYDKELSPVEVSNLYSVGILNVPKENTIPELQMLQLLTEPKLGETLTLDATATSGYPAPTYQWYYEGFPISSVAGGNLPVLSIPVTLNPSIEGTYRCVATNSEGTAEVQTQVVLFRDDDNDGLSNYQEENTHSTNPQDSDSDDDGLSDGAEVNNHETNPNSFDSDNDGFSDKLEIDELNTDPTTFNSAWGPFIVYEQDWVNTKDWLGWLKLQTDGWAWSSNENDYIWIPESSRDNSKGWVYHP